jgi:hypothetical protein
MVQGESIIKKIGNNSISESNEINRLNSRLKNIFQKNNIGGVKHSRTRNHIIVSHTQ